MFNAIQSPGVCTDDDGPDGVPPPFETAATTTEGAVAALHRVHCRSLVRLAVLLLDDVGAALHTALGGTI